MRNIIASLALSLLALPAPAQAMSRVEQNQVCETIFGETWQAAPNDKAKQYAQRFLANAKLQMEPKICTGEGERFEIAMSANFQNDRFLFIAIKRSYRAIAPDTIESIVAHEVAHLLTRDGGRCGNMLSIDGDRGKYELCEHAVDLRAAQWVGTPAMISMLEQVLRHFEELTRNTFNLLDLEREASLKRRITLLKNARPQLKRLP